MKLFFAVQEWRPLLLLPLKEARKLASLKGVLCLASAYLHSKWGFGVKRWSTTKPHLGRDRYQPRLSRKASAKGHSSQAQCISNRSRPWSEDAAVDQECCNQSCVILSDSTYIQLTAQAVNTPHHNHIQQQRQWFSFWFKWMHINNINALWYAAVHIILY